MQRRLSLLLIAGICFLSNSVYAQEAVRVIVLPFEIHAQEDLSYLKTEISAVIKGHLKQDGAIVLEPVAAPGSPTDALEKETAEGIEEIRSQGVKSGADFVIWGSLTRIGKKFSLDVKMAESFGEASPSIFFKEGDSIENLLGAVRDLARDLGIKLFKQEKIARVLVEGNKRIEVDAIKKIIKTKPGDIYLAKNLSEDLKAVYSMGYFEDIRIEAESGPDGKAIVFKVKEKPTVRIIRTKGNRLFKEEEIKENLDIKTGSILNIFKVQSNLKRIEDLYKSKNYHNVVVNYAVHPLENNQADLEFVIEEGEKLRIKEIRFVGNAAYSNKKLKGLMKTSEKGFFSWLTSSGDLNKEDLNQDIAKLAAFYNNSGYIQAKIGDPQIEFKEKWIDVTIKVEEGTQFMVGQVDIAGDLVLPKEELEKKLKITKEKFYNREVLRSDVLALTDLYSDEGYAYADISPNIDRDAGKKVVNITYNIKKGEQVYFEKIIIAGNTKTRDKVIRRELKVYEQELYSGKGLKRGVRNLYRLDFFKDIKADTTKGSADDKMILKIDVAEKPTGALSFGGGYSSSEDFFAMAAVTQRNLFGRGQELGVKAELGGRSTRYTLSFTEPWLFDIPLSAGGDLYNFQRDYDTYDRDSKGGTLRLSYPVFNFTRAYLSYTYDVSDIKGVNVDASKTIKDLKGVNVTSSVTTALRYDSRDRMFNPTEGSNHSLTIQYAGLGGDIGFAKYVGDTGWYIPLGKDFVGFLHGKTGYVRENAGKKLPDYERFYLGGINSMRGFDWRDISPTDADGVKIGGDKFVLFNTELMYPISKKAGLMGVVFFDMGNVYGNDENLDLGNLRQSAGYGFRWYSPIGPMRLENGYIINPREGERTDGRWEFTMGGAF